MITKEKVFEILENEFTKDELLGLYEAYIGGYFNSYLLSLLNDAFVIIDKREDYDITLIENVSNEIRPFFYEYFCKYLLDRINSIKEISTF